MDWTATILSLAGGMADPKFSLDGIDIMPIMPGRKKRNGQNIVLENFST